MLIEKVKTEYELYRIPGIIMTNRDTLIAYYECRRADSDWADTDIKIIRSETGGDTWETVDIIKSGGNTLSNPVMMVNGDTIHLLYCKNYKQVFHSVSTDDGKNFSAPEEISEVFEKGGFFYNVVAIGPGHGVLHNGNIIIPAWFAYNKENPNAHHPSLIRTIYSPDNGNTWCLGEEIKSDILIDPSECALALTKDNTLLISIRNEGRCRLRAFAESKTGFDMWENISFNENMPDPVCQGSMVNCGDTILHINCEYKLDRNNLTLKQSNDNFKTFKSILIDTEGGYSDIAAKGNEVYVLYERKVVKDGLYFKKIKLDW